MLKSIQPKEVHSLSGGSLQVQPQLNQKEERQAVIDALTANAGGPAEAFSEQVIVVLKVHLHLKRTCEAPL